MNVLCTPKLPVPSPDVPSASRSMDTVSGALSFLFFPYRSFCTTSSK